MRRDLLLDAAETDRPRHRRGRGALRPSLASVGLVHLAALAFWMGSCHTSLDAGEALAREGWMRGSSCRVGSGFVCAVMVVVVGVMAASAWASTGKSGRAPTSAYFRGPGRNLVCGYFAGNGVSPYLECGVRSVLTPSPPKPSAGACHGLDFAADRVRLGATGVVHGFCSGDVGVLAEINSAPVLAYGTSWQRGSLACTASVAWLTAATAVTTGSLLAVGAGVSTRGTRASPERPMPSSPSARWARPSLLVALEEPDLLAEVRPTKLEPAAVRWHGRLGIEATATLTS